MAIHIGEKITTIDWDDTRLPEPDEEIRFNSFRLVEQGGNETMLIYTLNEDGSELDIIRCSSRVVMEQLNKLAISFEVKVLEDELVELKETIRATFTQRTAKNQKKGYSDYWILL